MMTLVVMLLAACLLPSVVKAETVIDYSVKGSVTLYKYNGNPLEGLDEYSTQAEMEAAVNAAAGDLVAMEGIEFSYLKIGEVKQYTKVEDGKNIVKIGYTVDSATKTFLGLEATDVDITINSIDYYTTTTLDNKLTAKTQATAEAFMKSKSADVMPKTTNTGKTEVTGMDLGLYLFVETGFPATTVSITKPFLVSVPMTDKATNGDFNWIYDIKAYPKNKVESIKIDKNIVDASGNEMKEIDAEIGKSVTFFARAEVPLQIGKLEKYTITDKLSTGLTYDADSYRVQGVKADGTRVDLTNGDEFAFVHAGQTLTWTFIPSELADAEKLTIYKGIEITYTAKLNKDAVVGKPGNPNEIKLEYSKDTNIKEEDGGEIITVVPSELPKVYTYAIDLLKYGDSDTGNPLQDVEFELQNKDEQKITVSEVAAGITGKYYLDIAGTAIIKTDATGKIYIKGLEAGKYFLKETKSKQGYNLLADKIEITITSNEGTYTAIATGTYAPIVAGEKYYQDAALSKEFIIPTGLATGKYVNFGGPDVYRENGNKVEMYKQNALVWSCTYPMDEDSGLISLTVNNTKGFRLPNTGDLGTITCYVIGLVAAAIALVGVVATKKRRKAN